MRGTLITILLLSTLPLSSGCSFLLPEISNQPVIRNPFPQLSKIAVAPFFNQSDEPTVDGREFAMAYFAELQETPGFEVVPVGVVEEAIINHRVDLSGPGEARRLAKLLGVDAVVVGAVTDYSPYYPPRCGMRVDWYTANPGYHEIPAGYGLPWNTPEEEFIPDSLAYEAKFSQARAQMANLAPDCDQAIQPLPQPPQEQDMFAPPVKESRATNKSELRLVQAMEDLPAGLQFTPEDVESATNGNNPSMVREDMTGTINTMLPGCPDDSCFSPLPSQGNRPACMPHNGPVLTHTNIYRGTDPEVTEALKGYVYFREDARFGGWEAYLQRSDDFVRFCCHMHISEMLSARGGSRKTRVVLRWPECR
ncbi:hypothetical protein [Bythopirellula polymerisocia]|uniref:Lipoprotein n=1 Tax=Bythopirellula polymerisocia TaxID=2528003 RepID=A0A5C6CWM4_9BACT|nr:hypothetical protein [Bythopirellula polymerisocia]TWU29363.1 hypothetical protein Pla144_01390 [Bythopirellula polymerisocia]